MTDTSRILSRATAFSLRLKYPFINRTVVFAFGSRKKESNLRNRSCAAAEVIRQIKLATETQRNRDRGTGRQGEGGTGRQGVFTCPLVLLSPCLLVSLSPLLTVSVSICLRGGFILASCRIGFGVSVQAFGISHDLMRGQPHCGDDRDLAIGRRHRIREPFALVASSQQS